MSDRRFPLEWPTGWPRVAPGRRTRSKYKVEPERAMQEMLHSARLLGARSIVLSTNVPIRKDGLPYSSVREPEDPGVALYWNDAKGNARVIACDCYQKVHENMRAIGLAIEGMRAIERSGASQILERAFAGFAALPASTSPPKKRTWRDVLELSRPVVTPEEVEQRYRALARVRHPDSGGSHETFVELGRAREEALREVSR